MWHVSKELKDLPESVNNILCVVQNRRLRLVLVPYKATSVQTLEAETYIPSMTAHHLQRQAKARYRTWSTGQAKFTAKA